MWKAIGLQLFFSWAAQSQIAKRPYYGYQANRRAADMRLLK